ncbi:hypothetical protein P7H62_10740 [Vagococcus carniphilus]|uniref:FtsX-like permease family protein n=1 Tax=Vagococcus carniphilus TaxID=218144 RepID=UPI002891F7A0|nr:FtsX-like permease family protein [Vagococcus carniphilus]MDT2831524.1 hypothetical protein [Vagococcus carniphilus]MDT2840246.1 hypothetical protein [Vagococcus carniphilus]MDT2854931.1 hypothetical protein [Vagococcus carniphilus]
MTTIRQSIVAAKYHKKLTVLYTLFFALLLFVFTLLSQLVLTQSIALRYILGKWDQIKNALPQVESTLNEQLVDSNDFVMTLYQKIFVLLIISSIFIFFLLSTYAAHVRREEINSLYYIGIKKGQILKHLLLELLIPIIVGFSSVLLLLVLFHSQFVSESITINRKFVDKYFDQPTLVFTQTEELSDLTSQKNGKPLTTSKPKNAILPYNRISLFDVNSAEAPFKQTFLDFLTNMLLLTLTAIIGSFIGFYSHITLLSYRRDLPA